MKFSTAFAILLVSAKTTVLRGACDYCTSGFDSASLQLPLPDFDDGNVTSCQDIQDQATAATAEECDFIAGLEPYCCPSTTDQYLCDFCPDGIENESLVCGIFLLASIAANETGCATTKIYEPICCPSTSEYKLPPVTEGDTCYICGSADVAMTTPDAKPMIVQDDEGDEPATPLTCAQQQDALNAERAPGTSCLDSLSSLYLFYSPSICGCSGYSPPNSCNICSGGTVNRDVVAPGDGNFTCGDRYDLLQHFTPGGCTLFNASGEIDLAEIDENCCTYTSSGHVHGLSFAGWLITSVVATVLV